MPCDHERVTGTGGAPDPREIVQLGPSGPPSRWRRTLVIGAVLIGSVVGWSVAHDGTSDSDSTPRPTPSRPTQTIEPDRVTVDIPAGPHLLGVTDQWELFGRGPDELVRIELASGRVIRTPVPGLRSTGPVSFIVGPDRAVVRPLDYVPGYQVVDGELPESLPPALRHGGPILPGPRPGMVWAWRSPGSAMRLIRLTGSSTNTTIRLPTDTWAMADGRGFILATTPEAVWWARPDRLTRISDGTLLAVGPTGWLVRECGHGRCATVVIDRRRGTRRLLPGPAAAAWGPVGVIAPDGSAAALFHLDHSTTATVALLDLHTGVRRPVRVRMSTVWFENMAVWSPDGRWLFVADAGRGLAVIDAATGEVRDLGVSLPAIEQLAVRTR
jgi:hypothetical protein